MQATVRSLDLPPNAQPRVFVADAAGNLFIVSRIVEPSGRPQIRVLKTDLQGNTLASIDFGGSVSSSGFGDSIAGAAVDPKGNLVIVGSTSSPDFPVVLPLIANTTGTAAFVIKIDSQLKNVLFSTRLAGTQGRTFAGALALDKAGNIYVTGGTLDTDLPVTPRAFQTKPPESNKTSVAEYAYLTEISSDSKSIVFSTYFGDSTQACTDLSRCAGFLARTFGSAIALDATGNVVIAGSTSANLLPVTTGVFGPSCGDCGFLASAGFFAKFSADGSKLLWATYVPVVSASPYSAEVAIATMALDGGGNIVAGGISSKGFPVTVGALQTASPVPGLPGIAGIVMKLDSAAQRLLFSTYLGGAGPAVTGLVLDSQGTIWVTGASPLDELPVPKGTPVLGNSYLVGLSADGSTLANIFTAPSGAAGRAIALTAGGSVTALGTAGTLLTATAGQGPSLVGVGNSAGLSVSNAVAPYELISLYGLGLGPQTPASAQVVEGVVTSSLGGVQVLFDGSPAPLLYAGPTQINAIVPSAVYGLEKTTMQIVTPSGILKGPTMLIRPSQPGVFSAPPAGPVIFAPAAAALNQDGSVNSAANPAALGSIVTVWASGGGVSSRPQPDGTILPFPGGAPTLPVSVYSFPQIVIAQILQALPPGPLSLEVLFAGDAPGLVAGVSQINFRLPSKVDSSLNNIGFALQIGDVRSNAFSIYLKPEQ